MITTADLVRIRIDVEPARYVLGIMRRADAEHVMEVHQFAAGREWRWLRAGEFTLDPVSTCQCCGAATAFAGGGSLTTWPSGQTRCAKHFDRNPCAIEGCTRSTSADGPLELDAWICGDHWRRYVPPRSMRRRAYLTFFRRAKRYGWTVDLRRQFWRYWATLVASARAKADGGSINIAEIERLFG